MCKLNKPIKSFPVNYIIRTKWTTLRHSLKSCRQLYTCYLTCIILKYNIYYICIEVAFCFYTLTCLQYWLKRRTRAIGHFANVWNKSMNYVKAPWVSPISGACSNQVHRQPRYFSRFIAIPTSCIYMCFYRVALSTTWNISVFPLSLSTIDDPTIEVNALQVITCEIPTINS